MNKAGAITYRSRMIVKIRFIWDMAGQIATRQGVPRSRQFAEILVLYLLRRLGPLVYFEQGLWQPRWSWKEKFRCMNGEQYAKRIDELNPLAYQCLGTHKVVEAALLRQFELPAAEYLGFLHVSDGTDCFGKPLTDLPQLEGFLRAMCPIKLCFKPVEGLQGVGFAAASIESLGEELVAVDVLNPQERLPLREFLRRRVLAEINKGLIIQRYIEQHPAMAAFNPSSVNTLRIWVLQCDSAVHIRGALLRMGRAGSPVDNSSQGGFLAPIDLATGRLGACKMASVFPELHRRHPDSGVQVEDALIPFWEESMGLAQATVRALPGLRFLGLDIAITKSGPIIVETNPVPDRISARNFGAPMADLLDCSANITTSVTRHFSSS